jgi:hypothetical protein
LLRVERLVLPAIDDRTNLDAPPEGGLEVLQYLRILQDANLDPDFVLCGIDRLKVELAAVLGQDRQ